MRSRLCFSAEGSNLLKTNPITSTEDSNRHTNKKDKNKHYNDNINKTKNKVKLPKGVVPSKKLLTTPPTDLDPSCVAQNSDPLKLTQSSAPAGSGATHPPTSAVPYFLYPDLDLAYDSHHQLHDDDPYWHRSPVDLDAVYIYDSDEDLSMYDDPPPMGDCPSDPPATIGAHSSSTFFRPQSITKLGPPLHPTREGLLDWQFKQGLLGYSSLILPQETSQVPTTNDTPLLGMESVSLSRPGDDKHNLQFKPCKTDEKNYDRPPILRPFDPLDEAQ